MTEITNRTALRQLMRDNKLTNADVAELSFSSVKTVESWLSMPGSAAHRNMPDSKFTLLALQLPSFIKKRPKKKGKPKNVVK